jgi:hypothetical protein
MTKNILVIANETAAGDELQRAIGGPGGSTRVLVVAPTLDSRSARRRLNTCIARLTARGIQAEGTIGDSDPLHATIGALHVFPADEIVIATQPRSSWLAQCLVDRVAERFDGPILQVVVDEDRALAAA